MKRNSFTNIRSVFVKNIQHNIVDRITKSLDYGDIVIGVFMDLKKKRLIL